MPLCFQAQSTVKYLTHVAVREKMGTVFPILPRKFARLCGMLPRNVKFEVCLFNLFCSYLYCHNTTDLQLTHDSLVKNLF
jgi:hypothetical protein